MFEVEKSPSTVKCSLCPKKVKKGSMRLTANLGSGYYPHYYHVECFAKTFKQTLENLLKSLPSWSVS